SQVRSSRRSAADRTGRGCCFAACARHPLESRNTLLARVAVAQIDRDEVTGGQSQALRRAVQEAVKRCMKLWFVEQEGVVALVALDLDEADISRCSVESVDQPLGLARRKQPVAGKGDDAE